MSWELAVECKTVLPWASIISRNRGWFLLKWLGSRVRARISPWFVRLGFGSCLPVYKPGDPRAQVLGWRADVGSQLHWPGRHCLPRPGFSTCDTGARAHLTWRLLGIPQRLSLPTLGTTPWQQWRPECGPGSLAYYWDGWDLMIEMSQGSRVLVSMLVLMAHKQDKFTQNKTVSTESVTLASSSLLKTSYMRMYRIKARWKVC